MKMIAVFAWLVLGVLPAQAGYAQAPVELGIVGQWSERHLFGLGNRFDVLIDPRRERLRSGGERAPRCEDNNDQECSNGHDRFLEPW